MQRHPLPRERQHRFVLPAGDAHRMQSRVEQYRMDAESADIQAGVLGQ
ncbi:hypothetical protein LAUMK13_02464 [Mycobacterium innocens]|uniref:Uncharacterized protein n=1 Tax=Mycobacterium innocens TaxID=2341083 RepID=A0A498PZX0_9MYCO|nr:hypothetical protein LAUMK13_02464 [Mycobacterium innocens]